MSNNIKLSHMNHWKTISYKQIDNFRDFYYEDKSNIAYYSDWDRILRYHKATGYDGIEVAPWDMADILKLFGTPKDFADFVKDHGLEISGMFHGADDSYRADKYDDVLAAGKAAVDLCAQLGGRHLNTCPCNNFYGIGPLDNEALQNAARVLSDIGEYAVSKGVQVGLHNEFFCAVNKENHHRFIEMTDPRYVFYCLDTAQIAIMGDNLLKFYETYHDRICTFHLKDTASIALSDSIRYAQDVEICDDGWRWFWEPGEGVLDFKALWQLVKKYHFQGWVSIEDDGTPDILASMALSSYYVKEVLFKIYQ